MGSCARALVRCLGFVLVTGSATDASTQITPSGPAFSGSTSAPSNNPADGSLRDRFSLERNRTLLGSPIESDRLLGLGQLGEVGTSQALRMLNGAVNPLVTQRATLVEARFLIEILAERVSDPQTSHSLLRIVTGTVAGNKGAQVHPFVRASAALALAAHGGPAALAALSQALHGDRESAEFAARALLAHPPASLEPLLADTTHPTATLARLFGDLGDQRSFNPLRSWVSHHTPELGEEAALALTRLGDYETLPLARHWLKEASPERRRTATEILLVSGSPEGEAALMELGRSAEQMEAFLELALRFPSPALAKPVWALIGSAKAEQIPKLLTILGRIGTSTALGYLGDALENPPYAELAGFALAQTTSPLAEQKVKQALTVAKVHRIALRVAVLRRLRFGESYPDLSSSLKLLARSKQPSAVAIGVWGLAALDPEQAEAELQNRDLTRARAAAQTALLQDDAFFTVAAARLATAVDPEEQLVFAFALLVESAADRVPTEVLLDLASQGSAASPLAVLALARRDEAELRPLLIEILNGPNTALRSHAALGLSQSRSRSAAGLLAGRYRRELDWRVRLAIVTALGARSESMRDNVLKLAARLDPAAEVRNAARLALAGNRFDLLARGRSAAMIRVLGADGNAKGPEPGLAVLLEPTPMLALPFAPDPDGLVVILGISTGSIELRVAAGTNLSKPRANLHPQEALLQKGSFASTKRGTSGEHSRWSNGN